LEKQIRFRTRQCPNNYTPSDWLSDGPSVLQVQTIWGV